MFFRSSVEADLDSLTSCTVTEPIRWADPERLTNNLASGEYRHDRIWVATDDDGRILARAVWWSFPGDPIPLALDCLYVDPGVSDRDALGADLLDAAHRVFTSNGMKELPGYHIFLPAGWRDDDAIVTAVGWRRAALARIGMTDELERLRYRWTPDAGVPEASTRLAFRAEPDDAVFLDLFERAAVGSLDAGTRKGIARTGAAEEARETLDSNLSMPGDRSMWRIAYLDGHVVGFAMPSANMGGPVVGYLGTLPQYRGQGLVDELLNEITRIHAADGAQQIIADTDVTNVPMARAFERNGYENFAVRLVLDAPA
ncbi:GNAT family N-acetyltransferase [Stackebrandtia soli]|uniref:GNAT family N-acetyltransferase n=1 Tax=Stackebrandtia soli TaxID=1892856 RepID=UPI0039EAAA78